MKYHKQITKAYELIFEANQILEQVKCDREDYESERSDAWRDSDNGDTYMDNTLTLEECMNETEDVCSRLEEITENE